MASLPTIEAVSPSWEMKMKDRLDDCHLAHMHHVVGEAVVQVVGEGHRCGLKMPIQVVAGCVVGGTIGGQQ